MRKLFIPVVLVVLVACMVIPAFATTEYIDYNDYVTNIQADGDNDLVTCDFSISNAFWEWESNNTWVDSTSPSFTFENTYGGILYCFPFGRLASTQLSLEDIPNGTYIKIVLSYTGNLSYGILSQSMTLIYYDASGNALGTESFEYYSGGSQIVIDGTINKPDGAVSLSIYSRTGVDSPNSSNNASSITVSLESLQMRFSISSLYRQQQLAGKTNELLKSVEEKLAENGQKLDDIIDYEVTPETPDGGEIVDDIGSAEDELMDKLDKPLQDLPQQFDEGNKILLERVAGFAFVAYIFDRFTVGTFFSDLLITSLSFGLLGSALNLVTSAVSKLRGDRGDSAGKRDKGAK